MNIRTTLYRSIVYFIISAFIAVLVTAIVVIYNKKFYKVFSLYLPAGIFVFLILGFLKAQPLIDKIVKKQNSILEKKLNDLMMDLSHIRNVNDIIRKSTDIIYESLNIKSVSVLLCGSSAGDMKKKLLEKFYSRGQVFYIKPIDMVSSLITFFAPGKVLNADKIYADKKFLNDSADIINQFKDLNIKHLIPIYNDRQIFAIICLGEKKSASSYKDEEIVKLQHISIEISHYVTQALDYEEWNQGQFVSGVLDLSSEILSKAVPVNLPKLTEISFGAFYIPRYREGIDYFDFITPTNIGVGVIATDISGRSINNAIYSVILRSSFHSCIEDAHSTFAAMQKLNKALYMFTKGKGNSVKAYYFYYDIYTMRLIYTNAGFQPLEIYRVDKNIYESLDSEGNPLGSEPNTNYGMGRTNLLVGDIGFLYSSALIDSKNQKGEKFGLTQLRRIIKENRQKHPTEISGILKEEFLAFMGSSSPDSNILVIIFKV